MPFPDIRPNDRAAARALLLSPEAYAFVLLVLVRDTYPPESAEDQGVLDWAPETIRLQLEQDFSIQVPKCTLDKLMAAISTLTSNQFYKDVQTFVDYCNIFSGNDFDPGEFDPADPAEILWGVTEACLIYPPNNDPQDTEFSAEVRTYIGQVLETEGILNPPDVLRLGLRRVTSDHVRADYADDPEMYSAIWKAQEGKQGELTEMLRRNLAEMAMQLKLLSLQHGNVDGVIASLGQMTQNLPESTNDNAVPSE